MRPPSLVVLEIVADLLRGGRHSRQTVARSTGRSLGTADRWLEVIEKTIPGARRVKVGKTAWVEIPQPEPWKAKRRLRSPMETTVDSLRAACEEYIGKLIARGVPRKEARRQASELVLGR